jgi:hypothetical protein
VAGVHSTKQKTNLGGGMSKFEILVMLKELLRTAVVSKTDPEDASGCNTIYLVDQERLIRNIEVEMEKVPLRKRM